MRVGVEGEVLHQQRDDPGDFRGLQRRRHAAPAPAARTRARSELETRLLPLAAPLQERGELMRLELENYGFQQ